MGWDWAEGRAGRAGLLQLCEHLGLAEVAGVGGMLSVSRGDKAKGGSAHDLAPCGGQALLLIKNA